MEGDYDSDDHAGSAGIDAVETVRAPDRRDGGASGPMLPTWVVNLEPTIGEHQ